MQHQEKFALCYDTNDFLDAVEGSQTFPVEKLLTLKTKLVSRSTCETDLNTLQIIPYVVLVDAKTDRYFIYTRGNAGGEHRLFGVCSVGVGGHVDELPIEGENDFFVHLAREAGRELKEEVGLNEAETFSKVYRALTTDKFYVFQTRTDRVSRVHVGFCMVIEVDMENISEVEHEIITKGQWLRANEIARKYFNGEIQLEEWSAMFLLNNKAYSHNGVYVPCGRTQ